MTAAAKPIPTLFRLIRERCGLTREEMADALGVRFDTFRAWDSGQRSAPDGAIADARALCDRILKAGHDLAARILKRNAKGITIGLATSERDALALGFSVPAAQHAAVGVAITTLPLDFAMQIAPWQAGMETARVVRIRDPAAVAEVFRKFKLPSIDSEISVEVWPTGEPVVAFRSEGAPLTALPLNAAHQLQLILEGIDEKTLAEEVQDQILNARRKLRG